MKRLYCVTMPDGVQYGIPAEYIAHLYAKCPGSSSIEGDGYLKMLDYNSLKRKPRATDVVRG